MIELHFAGYQPPRSVHTRALYTLRDEVDRRAGGRFALRVTDNIVSLGRKAADLLSMVESGELDGCYFASSYLTARVPALEMFDRPFQAGPREEVFHGLDGETGATVAAQVAAGTGFRVLGWWDNGIRHISNGVRPIRTPADCRGLRLRTLDNALHQAAFRRIGFQPQFVDVADLSRAVAEGEIDAQENPLTNMVNFDLHVHHKHVSLTGHLLGIALLLINGARYETLPPDLRHVLDAAVSESAAVQRAEAVAEDAKCLAVLADAGVSVILREGLDVAAFREAAIEQNA